MGNAHVRSLPVGNFSNLTPIQRGTSIRPYRNKDYFRDVMFNLFSKGLQYSFLVFLYFFKMQKVMGRA